MLLIVFLFEFIGNEKKIESSELKISLIQQKFGVKGSAFCKDRINTSSTEFRVL